MTVDLDEVRRAMRRADHWQLVPRKERPYLNDAIAHHAPEMVNELEAARAALAAADALAEAAKHIFCNEAELRGAGCQDVPLPMTGLHDALAAYRALRHGAQAQEGEVGNVHTEGCDCGFCEQIHALRADRADTTERDLAEARAALAQCEQDRDDAERGRGRRVDQVVKLETALATERATTTQVLADAERFVGQLISSDLVPWGEWGPFGPMKMGAFRMPTHQQAESLLAALRSARGVGE